MAWQLKNVWQVDELGQKRSLVAKWKPGRVARKPFVCDVAITFETARHAEEIANCSLAVDEELQPHKVTRTSVVRGSTMHVHFAATEVRMPGSHCLHFMTLQHSQPTQFTNLANASLWPPPPLIMTTEHTTMLNIPVLISQCE